MMYLIPEKLLEQLQLAEAELCQRNEELAAACKAAEAERQHYQELFEFAPDAYLVSDLQAVVQEANYAAVTMLKVKQQSLVGKALVVFVAEQERRCFRYELTRLCQVDRVEDWEVRLCPSNGEPIYASLSVTVVRNQKGEPVALHWLMRDMTERKRIEAMLCQTNEALKKEVASRQRAEQALRQSEEHFQSLSENALDIRRDITERKRTEEIRQILEKEKELSQLQLHFFSLASHEFRTPLSTILMSAQLLQHFNGEWPQAKKLRNVQRIETAAKNMIHLLDDILTINRAETGKLEFNLKLLDLEKFCRNLVEEMQLTASNRYTITFSSQGSCKNAYMDEKLLRSILSNLLDNAIKYSLQSSNVHFTLVGEQGKATFRIQDEGIGILPADQQQLFEPFYRGKNVDSIAGTGLGLTVVKKCVDLHGGKITVDSEVGVGTTFTVTLLLNSH